MAVQNEVLEKLAKLIRHEQSAREIGSVAEAEAFAAKVQELLTTHKLEMSQVQFEEREHDEEIEREFVTARDLGIKRTKGRVEWQEDLAYSIARANGCKTIVTNASNSLWFVGRTTDRQICAQLYVHFMRMAFDLAERAGEENRDKQRTLCQARFRYGYYNNAVFAHWMNRFRRSFCVGFSYAVGRRLDEQYNALLEKKEAADGAESTALVHIRRDAEAINEFLAELFKDRKPSKAKERIEDAFDNLNSDGYHAGQRKGREVALTANALNEGRAISGQEE